MPVSGQTCISTRNQDCQYFISIFVEKGFIPKSPEARREARLSVVPARNRSAIAVLEMDGKWMVCQNQSHSAPQPGCRAVDCRPNTNTPCESVLLYGLFNHRPDKMPHTGDLPNDQNFGRGKRRCNHAHPRARSPATRMSAPRAFVSPASANRSNAVKVMLCLRPEISR